MRSTSLPPSPARRPLRFAVAALALGVLATGAARALDLPAILSDGVVFQKGKPVRLWGSAQPGEQVTATWGKESRQAVTGPNGQWRMEFAPMDQSPGDIQVTGSGGGKASIRGPAMGQVWICGGQSNMMISLSQTDGAPMAGKPLPAPAALRLYRVPAPNRERRVEGRWASDAPEVASEFSSVCYLTGRLLAEHSRGVVGLVDTSAGGTSAEAWTPGQGDRPPQHAQGRRSRNPLQAEGAAFESLAKPVAPLSAAGLLWYQGEANRRAPEGYAQSFAAAMDGWRRAFEQPDLPVFYMQLPPFPNARPQGGWEAVRSEQARAEKLLPRMYMVPSDGLVATELHPREKTEVARRFFARITGAAR